MFKLSHYLVITEPVAAGKRVLFATRTARTLVITDTLYDKLQRGAWDEISDRVFDKLRTIEAIVPAAEREVHTIIARNKATVADGTSLYHVIQPTAMCQLGCGYCGQKHTKDYIGTAHSDLVLERIASKFSAKPYRHVEIAWFGSEPLMGWVQIRSLTPRIQALARERGCTYSAKLVTNGLSLKVPIFLELVQQHGVKSIEVTLDGTAEHHDARRHTKDGLSTFKLIFQNLLAIYNLPNFKELGCDISIRCNVDERNSESVIPLLHLLAEHELQDKIAYFYVAPIHAWGNEAHLLSLEKQAFGEQEITWMIEMIRLGFTPRLLPSLNPVVCMSVTPDAEVFDAFGNVFDCTEVPYVESYDNTEYILGNVGNGLDTISTHRPLLSFHDDVADGKYPCTTCRMLPVCGGGCPKSWREGMPPCPSNKFNIESKLMLHYALHRQGKEEFVAILNQTA
ncbi:radical SAM/SPASM domain-containing protein [Rhabdobacter roseus]|uniref:Radical SAM core domain-containing protein n=1 Tax=Rhabdobacter roseus TaxID=1655419 RepID=A0A840U528_9BACT|nr:radical SAM protein [Rhabdobacter roseus]MBB5287190.1 uncharacterized protein [Rhabdobacter roseus]